jgi:hypothetical protein
MVKQHKQQKEMAAFFGCSDAAISKRLKRLIIPPESFEVLTDKEKKFVISKLSGKTNTAAAMDAYECTSLDSAKNLGSHLMQSQKIMDVIAEMSKQGLTVPYRIGKLKTLIDHIDPNIIHKGLDMSFKLDGSYAPEKSLNLNINLDISPEEIQALQELANKMAQEEIRKIQEASIDHENNEDEQGQN